MKCEVMPTVSSAVKPLKGIAMTVAVGGRGCGEL